jgi:mersacidin/lichenicidin family type 2 lantibiotic
MSNADIIRAWKDPQYRASLSPEEQALLPAHPAGLIELEDAYLDLVAGGRKGTDEFPGCGSLGSACHRCTAAAMC